jgi:hypothetical protein
VVGQQAVNSLQAIPTGLDGRGGLPSIGTCQSQKAAMSSFDCVNGPSRTFALCRKT